MNALLLFLIVCALLILRQPLLVILLAAIAYAQIIWGGGHLTWIIEDMFVSLDKELILAIPMFMLCGGVMTKGSTARRLTDVARALTGHLPGGLGIAAIISSAIFAAISGSSIVTMLAIGSVVYPAMREAGYNKRFALGAVMSGGTLGIIIPPSIPLILYGLVTESSIVDLFRAGVGPGILLVLLMTVYSVAANRHMPTTPFSLETLRHSLRRGIWALLMPVILLGGIYSGLFSPTEAAAVALMYSVVIELAVHREIGFADLKNVVLEAAKLGGALFPLIAVALSLNLILIENRVPDMMLGLVDGWITSPITFIIIVNLLLLGVGAMMTTAEAILILAPILAPIAAVYGFNKIVFGIIMIVNLEIGLLTPPVGLNLIVAMSAFKEKFGLLVRAALPFIALMVLALALISWLPEISLYFVN
ncbi:C4-dicarboxylate transporter, DctM subunit [Thalassovita litoralis]|jgi:C4-dicarboxylate transporter DctM subunit|uniref:TRAP transporter large permease protein n=1 Tax=Thalassovita litoralis TaxID=1010611 RepID=A0A521D6I6_9RHOB|nr:TRAP transporter large permease [Thalassovita litoralis]SMO67242.1 C4-dicarboxylate transporter, DctM subunit [Thalassovita litoralis]